MRRIAIVGGNTAGLAASMAAREIDKEAKITVISEESYLPYRRPSIPRAIEQEKPNVKNFSMFSPRFLGELKVKLRRNACAQRIHRKRKTVKIKGAREMLYDTLILATGARAAVPEISGLEKKRVFTLRSMMDALKISRWTSRARSATVVGGGFVGLMVAEGLWKKEVKVTLVEVCPNLLPGRFEPDLSKLVQNRMEKLGVQVITSGCVDEIGGGRKVEYVKILDRRIDSSLVVLATGVRPNTSLAQEAGIKLDQNAVKVDEYMRTSDEYVFAAGDCTRALDYVTGRTSYMPIGSIAAAQGILAGKNAAGSSVASQGFIRAQNENIFGDDLVSIGCSVADAERAGIEAEAPNVTLPAVGRSRRFSKGATKLVVDKSGTVIGAQMICQLARSSSYVRDVLDSIKKREKMDDLTERWKEPHKTLIECLIGRASGLEMFPRDLLERR